MRIDYYLGIEAVLSGGIAWFLQWSPELLESTR